MFRGHVAVWFLAFVLVSSLAVLGDEVVEVKVDPTCVRSVGGITCFDRSQFINIHASPRERDLTEEDYRFLKYELEVSYGRDGGLRTWQRRFTKEDPQRPGFPDLEDLRRRGSLYQAAQAKAGVSDGDSRDMILCTHPEYYYPHPEQHNAPWGPRSMEAAAEFTAYFLLYFYRDTARPRFLEVVNEPFIGLGKVYPGTVDGVCRLHQAVAARVHALAPNVLVGGPTAAYPEFEARDFAVWNGWMKRFIDIAGADMDFISYHIYDDLDAQGRTLQRTGSNMEAILDIIDTYTHLQFGQPKPHVVSEFGGVPGNKGYGPYSTWRDAWMLRSLLGQTFVFMKHPDRYLKVVPFILTKADWSYQPGKSDEPYAFLLWRKTGAGYVTTELVLYYKFWKGVAGQWCRSDSTDPDVICHLLRDGTRLNLLLMNLEKHESTVGLSGLDNLSVSKVTLRTLRTEGQIPILLERTLPTVPNQIVLTAGEAALLALELSAPVKQEAIELETRHYADCYLQSITAGKPVTFKFTGLPADGQAKLRDARLRLAIGREHGKCLTPLVRIAGHTIEANKDWIGGDQKPRDNFFGVIEVDIPPALVQPTTTVEVVFPDSGGRIASAVLQLRQVKNLANN